MVNYVCGFNHSTAYLYSDRLIFYGMVQSMLFGEESPVERNAPFLL